MDHHTSLDSLMCPSDSISPSVCPTSPLLSSESIVTHIHSQLPSETTHPQTMPRSSILGSFQPHSISQKINNNSLANSTHFSFHEPTKPNPVHSRHSSNLSLRQLPSLLLTASPHPVTEKPSPEEQKPSTSSLPDPTTDFTSSSSSLSSSSTSLGHLSTSKAAVINHTSLSAAASSSFAHSVPIIANVSISSNNFTTNLSFTSTQLVDNASLPAPAGSQPDTAPLCTTLLDSQDPDCRSSSSSTQENNVNATLDRTISDVLNLAQSGDPHPEVFSIQDRNSSDSAETLGLLDNAYHYPSASSVFRDFTHIYPVNMSHSFPPGGGGGVKSNLIAFSVNPSSALMESRYFTAKEQNSKENMQIDTTLSEPTAAVLLEHKTRQSLIATKKRSKILPNNRSVSNDKVKRVKLTAQQQQQQQPPLKLTSLMQLGVTNGGGGTNFPSSLHTLSSSSPTYLFNLPQQMETERKKILTLQQRTALQLHHRHPQQQLNINNGPLSWPPHYWASTATASGAHLSPALSHHHSTILKALMQRDTQLEESRWNAIRKYQTHLFQGHVHQPKTVREMDLYLLQEQVVAYHDVHHRDHFVEFDVMENVSSPSVLPDSPFLRAPDSVLENLERELRGRGEEGGVSRNCYDSTQPDREMTPPIPLAHLPSVGCLELLQQHNIQSTSTMRCYYDNTVTTVSAPSLDSGSMQETSLSLLDVDKRIAHDKTWWNRCFCQGKCLTSQSHHHHHWAGSGDMQAAEEMDLALSKLLKSLPSSLQHPPPQVTFCSLKCKEICLKWLQLWKRNFSDTRLEMHSRCSVPLLILSEMNLKRKSLPVIKMTSSPLMELDIKLTHTELIPAHGSRKRKRLLTSSSSLKPFTRAKPEANHPRDLSRTGPALRNAELTEVRQCVLCCRSHSEDVCGRFICFGSRGAWIHQYCALWSSHCNKSLLLESHFAAALRNSCYVCSKPGAGRECELCGLLFHYPCAAEVNCSLSLQPDAVFHCAYHDMEAADPHPSEVSPPLLPLLVTPQESSSHIVKEFCQLKRWPSSSAELELMQQLRIGSLVVQQLGHLETCHLYSGNFHTATHIYPLGYRAVRYYWSCKHPMKRCAYICEILSSSSAENPDASSSNYDSGQLWPWTGGAAKPLFRVTAVHIPTVEEPTPKERVFLNVSCTTLWKQIGQAIRGIQTAHRLYRVHTKCISGERMFGLEEPWVRLAIESLPGVQTLNTYAFTHPVGNLVPIKLEQYYTQHCSRVQPCPGSHYTRREAYAYPIASQLQSVSGTPVVWIKAAAPSNKHSHDQQLLEKIESLIQQEWENNVYIAPSRIHGFGVFAARDFEPGQFIIRYVGEFIRPSVAMLRLRHYRKHRKCAYFLRLSDQVVVDSTVVGGAGRYLQHACQPNCGMEAYAMRGVTHLVFVAKRKIQQTEELTFCYYTQPELNTP